jgi:hypothetical protein
VLLDQFVREAISDVIGDFALPLLLVTMILADIMQYSQGQLAEFSDIAFAVGGCMALVAEYYLRKSRRGVAIHSTGVKAQIKTRSKS